MRELTTFTVSELSELLGSKELHVTELTLAYLNRIQSVEPTVGAFLTLTAELALEDARRIDATVRTDTPFSNILNGIPYAAKDNLCTSGIATTCGSKMLSAFVPCYSAAVIEALRKRNAVLLGKTNMDEFGMGSSTETSAFRITANPRDTSRIPGGSSGGSAAAVAANEAAFALGSDTGGSVRQPAAYCGVVGMKPTYGRVSRDGLIAFASSLDQVGAITKTVLDNALVLEAISEPNGRDSTHVPHPGNSFTRDIALGVKGMRIGIAREFFTSDTDPSIRDAVLGAARLYESLGAELIDISLPHLGYALPAYYVISSAEASSNLSRFDGVRYGHRTDIPCDGIDELYLRSRSEAFGDEVKRRIILGAFALSAGYRDDYYKKAVHARALISREFDEVFGSCELMLTPVTPTLPRALGSQPCSAVDGYRGDAFTVPASITGHPALSMPCSVTSDGLPIGMQLIGKRFAEAELYRAAYAFETASGLSHLTLPLSSLLNAERSENI